MTGWVLEGSGGSYFALVR